MKYLGEYRKHDAEAIFDLAELQVDEPQECISWLNVNKLRFFEQIHHSL